jgi:alkylhydroperoxidase family enzyme
MAPRIQPVEDAQVSPEVRQYFQTAEERGAPNATLLRILAREPNSLHVFYDSWNDIFYKGRVDHGLKEIVRVRMARLRGCGY